MVKTKFRLRHVAYAVLVCILAFTGTAKAADESADNSKRGFFSRLLGLGSPEETNGWQWSELSLRWLKDPRKMSGEHKLKENSAYDGLYSTAYRDVGKGWELFVKPMMEEIGEILPGSMNSLEFNHPSAQLNGSRDGDKEYWRFFYSHSSSEQISNIVNWHNGKTDYSSARSGISVSVITEKLEETTAYDGADKKSGKYFEENKWIPRKEGEYFGWPIDLKYYDRSAIYDRNWEERTNQPKKEFNNLNELLDELDATPEIIRYRQIVNRTEVQFPKADKALIQWDEKSRYTTMRWRRGSHVIELDVVAPTAGSTKSYITDIATKVDAVLERHGFYEFPYGFGTQTEKISAFEVFDANPLFSANKKTFPKNLTSDQLMAHQTVRKGTTADGVSQLILRAEVNEDAAVDFKLVDDKDGKIEPLLGGKTIKIEGLFSSDKYFAFALYTPPQTYDIETNAKEDEEDKPDSELAVLEDGPDREMDIRDVTISIQPAGGKALTRALTLARPPVVLVHGLFSDPVQTWVKTYENGYSMAALLEQAGFVPFLVNYQSTNGSEAYGSWISDDTIKPPSALKSNYSVIWNSPLKNYENVTLEYGYSKDDPIKLALKKPAKTRIGGIKQAVEYYRAELDLAATQAMVVGHSMGGILARVWASPEYNKFYKRPENFDEGDIDRILTLNTPHFGSELMELKDSVNEGVIGKEGWFEWAKARLVQTVLWWFFDPERGAVRDLRPGSEALKAIGQTQVPSYALATSATSAEIGAEEKDPLKLYNSLYTVAGNIFFNNRPLLDDFVEDRYKEWESTPANYRKNTTEVFRTKNNKAVGKSASVFDLTIPDNRKKYKRLINNNIDENLSYWVHANDRNYLDGLRQAIEKTIILPFGSLDANMGSYKLEDYLDLELLSNDKLLKAGAKRTNAGDIISEVAGASVPLEFMSILRDLIFHQDPNTDAVVRVVSQMGGIDEKHSELVERVLHTYSPWDYDVQKRVISLLSNEIRLFSKAKDGFPRAGQPTPRYMPSTKFVSDLVDGDLAIKWSGMVPSHAAQFKKISDKENIFILSRPVNSSSTQLLLNCHEIENNMANCAAAKGMNVKGKSSNWGPQVGYIPFDQRYSKLWRTVRDPTLRKAQIKKYNKETLKSTQAEHPTKTERFFAVTRALTVKMKSSGITCNVLTDPEVDNAEEAVLLQCPDGFYDWKNSTDNNKPAFDSSAGLGALVSIEKAREARMIANPMYVLADDTSDLELGFNDKNEPIRPYLTADYDLLAIGQVFASAKCGTVSEKSDNDSNCKPFELPEVADAEFDDLSGVVSEWQNGLLDRINAEVADAGYRGGLVTHHGPENQYYDSPYVDYPILVFDPGSKSDKSDASNYLIRQGPPGFRDIHFKRFVTEKARLGYNIWPNPKSEGWKWEFWRPFSIKTGYDPRDRSNMPPYVAEAPLPTSKPTNSAREQKQETNHKNGDTKESPVAPAVNEQVTKNEKPAVTAITNGVKPVEPTSSKTEVESEKNFVGTNPKPLVEQNQPEKEQMQQNAGITKKELDFWNAIKNLGNEKLVKLYLQEYPNGSFRKEAELQLNEFSQKPEENLTETTNLVGDECDRLAGSHEKYLDWGGVDTFHDIRPRQAIPACRKAVKEMPDVARFAFQLARALDVNNMRKRALAWYEKAAKSGSLGAMYNLALRLQSDNGNAKNPNEKVMFWLTNAAEQNFPPAMAKLGDIYSRNRDDNKSTTKAYSWYKLGAENGDARSMAGLGSAYKHGIGVRRDYRESTRWYLQSAGLGDVSAMKNVSKAYEKGLGISKSKTKAEFWRKKLVVTQIAKLRYATLLDHDSGRRNQKMNSELAARKFVVDIAQEENWKTKLFYQNVLLGEARAFSKEFRGHVQQLLKKQKIYNGPIDGIFNAATIKAINKLREKNLKIEKPPQPKKQVVAVNNQPKIKKPTKKIKTQIKRAEIQDCDWLAGQPAQYHAFFGYDKFVWIKPYLAIPACKKALKQHPNVARFQYQMARALAARGLTKDKIEAVAWYQRAAKNTNVAAMYSLANSHYYGYTKHIVASKKLRQEKAIEWLVKAAKQNFAPAYFVLGRAYSDPLDWKLIDKSLPKAIQYYKRGVKLKNADSMAGLAKLYEKGRGLEQSFKKAEVLYRNGAELGSSRAMRGLAKLYKNGKGVPLSLERQQYWSRKADSISYADEFHQNFIALDTGINGFRRDSKSAAESFVGSLRANLGWKIHFYINEILSNGAREFSKEFRQEVQVLLKKLNQYDGPIDGKFNQATKISIKELGAIKRNPKEPPLDANTRVDAEGVAQVWASVQNSSSIAVLKAFIKQFPQSIYANLANARIEELQAEN